MAWQEKQWVKLRRHKLPGQAVEIEGQASALLPSLEYRSTPTTDKLPLKADQRQQMYEWVIMMMHSVDLTLPAREWRANLARWQSQRLVVAVVEPGQEIRLEKWPSPDPLPLFPRTRFCLPEITNSRTSSARAAHPRVTDASADERVSPSRARWVGGFKLMFSNSDFVVVPPDSRLVVETVLTAFWILYEKYTNLYTSWKALADDDHTRILVELGLYFSSNWRTSGTAFVEQSRRNEAWHSRVVCPEQKIRLNSCV